jgi:aspartate aminotransferase
MANLPLSERSRVMPASPIRRLAHYADGAKARGVKVLHLNIGQPDIEAPEIVMERLRSYPGKFIPYGPSQGQPELVDGFLRYYRKLGHQLTAENVFVTTGGSEAALIAFLVLFNPGDEILVPEPFYTNYNGFAVMADVRLVPVPTKVEDGYRLPPLAEIESRVTGRTRGLLVCSPNNPTGAVFSAEEWDTVRDLVRRRGLFLLSDEAYREFVYEGECPARSALSLAGIEDQVVVVDSLSKRLSLCGARVGALVTRNAAVWKAALKVGQARLCSPSAEQYAAAALPDVPEAYTNRVREEYRRRRDLVFEALSAIPGVVCRKPSGAFYICARLPVASAEDFAIFLLEQFSVDGATVMVAPNDGFYATPGRGRNEIRIAYVLQETDLARAMGILKEGLEAFARKVPAGKGS